MIAYIQWMPLLFCRSTLSNNVCEATRVYFIHLNGNQYSETILNVIISLNSNNLPHFPERRLTSIIFSEKHCNPC